MKLEYGNFKKEVDEVIPKDDFKDMSEKFKVKKNEAAIKMKEKSEEAAAKMKDIKEKMATKFKSFF
jgi:hypothetical protein